MIGIIIKKCIPKLPLCLSVLGKLASQPPSFRAGFPQRLASTTSFLCLLSEMSSTIPWDKGGGTCNGDFRGTVSILI